jgi:hypothetical protein
MAGVPRARYRAEVAWDKAFSGYFTIGVSLIGGSAGLAPSGYATSFLGPLDNISADLASFNASRGRQEQLDTMERGELALNLRDRYIDGGGQQQQGKYNVKNTDSPLYGKIKPLRPGRVVATYAGVEYGLSYGFLRDGEARPGPRKGQATFNFVDFMLWLGGEAIEGAARPIIAATGPTTTGAAIGLILTNIGWTEPSMRRLDVGDAIPNFSADGTKTALELIQELLVAERGILFVNGSGVVVYQSRNARATQASLATISDEFAAMPTGFSLEKIRTRARVQRAGGIVQEYSDPAARTEWGDRDFEEIVTRYLASDNQAASLAQWLVSQAKDVKPVVWSLELEGRTPALLTQVLARDVGDRVTVTEAVQGTQMDAFIERVEHRLPESGVHAVTWLLSERKAAATPFQIGVSLIGGSHVLSY